MKDLPFDRPEGGSFTPLDFVQDDRGRKEKSVNFIKKLNLCQMMD